VAHGQTLGRKIMQAGFGESNYIKGKFCVSVCVSVRNRTYLNVVRMGSKLLGVLRKTLRWSSTGQILKNNLFKKFGFFKRETHKKRENGMGTRNRNGGGNGRCVRPEQRRVPPTIYERGWHAFYAESSCSASLQHVMKCC
jgi:hypothetical protein